MRTVMLVSRFNINAYTKVIVVDIYRGINEMCFFGYSDKEIALNNITYCTIGMWKIKKIK